MVTTAYRHQSLGQDAIAFVTDGEIVLNVGALDQMHTVEELEAVGQVLSEVRRDLRGGGGVRRVGVTRETIESDVPALV
jgi:hypothetical protein